MMQPLRDPICLNCGAELHGSFCHRCGQKVTEVAVGLPDFAHEAAQEFLNLDSKIVNTVRVLVSRPGEPTKDFAAGRRARYISPLRLYLTFSVLYFFLAAVVPGAQDTYIRIRTTGDANAAQVATATRARDVLNANLPRIAFVIMPAFALLTFIFFRRRQPYFIHSHVRKSTPMRPANHRIVGGNLL